jgi:hypothetical protein
MGGLIRILLVIVIVELVIPTYSGTKTAIWTLAGEDQVFKMQVVGGVVFFILLLKGEPGA